MNWQEVVRMGFCPQFMTSALGELRAALMADDETLTQGVVCVPEFTARNGHEAVHAAEPWAWLAMRTLRLGDVAAVWNEAARIYRHANGRLLPGFSVEVFYRWFDATDRREAFRELADVLAGVLAERGATESVAQVA